MNFLFFKKSFLKSRDNTFNKLLCCLSIIAILFVLYLTVFNKTIEPSENLKKASKRIEDNPKNDPDNKRKETENVADDIDSFLE